MVWFLFALGSAIFAALSALTEKKSLIKIHAMEFSCALAILNFLLSLPLIFLADFNIPLFVLVVMYASSIIATVAFLFIAKAVRHLEVSLVSPLLNLNPAILFRRKAVDNCFEISSIVYNFHPQNFRNLLKCHISDRLLFQGFKLV